MKTNLYINLGNTNIVFGYSKTNDINNIEIIKISSNEIKDLDTNKIIENTFKKIEKEIEINNIYISSVVAILEKKFKDYLNAKKYVFKFITYKDVNFIDLTNLYNAYELGVDILSQICYVSMFFEEAIVVSVGTASVIYHISKKAKLSGCVILPGIEKSLEALINSTDIQNVEIINTNNILGLNTSEAVSIGIINMIQNYVMTIKKEMKLNSKCPIICTGGNSKYFKNNKWWFIEDLEILGLFALDKIKKLSIND